MDLCTDYSVLNALSILQKIFTLICIIIPVILVILTMISIFKAVTSNEDDAIKSVVTLSIRRFVTCFIIIFLPTIGKVVMNTINDSTTRNFDLLTCFANSNNLDYYKDLSTDKKETTKPTTVTPLVAEIKKTTTTDLPQNEDTIGKLYSLTDDQIRYLAAVCEEENGYTENGMAAEANLILNKYQRANKEKYTDIAYYVRNARWWSTAKSAETYTPSEKAISIVKSVIEYGNKIYPSNVVEHDAFNNIEYLVVNGKKITDPTAIKDKSNYIQGQTIIHNKNMDEDEKGYYFYDFPCDKCDPFGYY